MGRAANLGESEELSSKWHSFVSLDCWIFIVSTNSAEGECVILAYIQTYSGLTLNACASAHTYIPQV